MPNPPRYQEWSLADHKDAYHAGLHRLARLQVLSEWQAEALWNDRNNWPEMAEVREILETEE